MQGFWELFWATGLPEAWLVTRIHPDGEEEEGDASAPTCPPSGEF